MEQKATAYLFCVIILLCLSFDCCRCEDAASSFSSQESGSHKKNSTGSRYCGNSLVRAMRLICDGYYAEPSLKRSLDYSYDSGQPSQPKRRINRKYKIWKRRFNLQDNDLTTWPELDRQYQLLFGSEVHQNDRLPATGFFSFKDAYVKGGEQQAAQKPGEELGNESRTAGPKRNKRGIYEECCRQPCTVGYMKSYCLQT